MLEYCVKMVFFEWCWYWSGTHMQAWCRQTFSTANDEEMMLTIDRRNGVQVWNGQSDVPNLFSVVLQHYMSVSTPGVPPRKCCEAFWERLFLSHSESSPCPSPPTSSSQKPLQQWALDHLVYVYRLLFFLKSRCGWTRVQFQQFFICGSDQRAKQTQSQVVLESTSSSPGLFDPTCRGLV